MFKILTLCASTSSQKLSAVSDISVNNVVLLSAPDSMSIQVQEYSLDGTTDMLMWVPAAMIKYCIFYFF